jgi:hypothetical protein
VRFLDRREIGLFLQREFCHFSALDPILNEIKVLQGRSLAKRVLFFAKDPERIVDMRKVFDDAIGLFNVRITPLMFEVGILLFPDIPSAGLHDNHEPRCC